MKDQELLERIALNPRVIVGKPVIRGNHLSVEYILNLLAHGATVTEILEEYHRNNAVLCCLFTDATACACDRPQDEEGKE